MEQKDKKFSEWKGIPREEIDWHPTIDENRCIGCGMCVTSCGRKVYRFEYCKKKPIVTSPNNCLVGCQTCANLCPAKAIKFAEGDKTRKKAQKIITEFDILPKIKKELELRKSELKTPDGCCAG